MGNVVPAIAIWTSFWGANFGCLGLQGAYHYRICFCFPPADMKANHLNHLMEVNLRVAICGPESQVLVRFGLQGCRFLRDVFRQ